MHTYDSLRRDIEALGIRPTDTLMIHASMKAIGTVEGGAETVLDVFSDYLVERGLLLLPTHTWQDWNCKDNIFDPAREPVCVGILPELFRQRPGVVRSWHPTHSVAALGQGAEAFVAGEEHTRSPGPKGSCWRRLYDVDARILFLGASLKTNTFLHSVEEWYAIPDRLASEPTLFKICTPSGELIDCPQHRHHSSRGDVSKHYDKVLPLFLAEGAAVEGTIGSARSYLCQARVMGDLVGARLKLNPALFDDDRPL